MNAGAPPPRDWRQDVVGASGIAVLLGLWLVASPLVLGYGTDDASWNPIACGALAIGLALAQVSRLIAPSTPGWILMAIGLWLFVSGFLLADSSQAAWNSWGAGALMFYLGAVNVAAAQRRDLA